MSAQFKVGEIARHIANPSDTAQILMLYDGQECEIIGGLEWRKPYGDDALYLSYDCRFSDGTELLCAPHELRKRRPPASDESAHRQAMLDCIERAKRGAGAMA